jgi:hypothetical protein
MQLLVLAILEAIGEKGVCCPYQHRTGKHAEGDIKKTLHRLPLIMTSIIMTMGRSKGKRSS